MLKAQLEIASKTNKEGKPYQIMTIYIEAPNGDLVPIQEVYLKDHIIELLKYFQKVSSTE